MPDDKPLKLESRPIRSLLDATFRLFSQNFVELITISFLCSIPTLLYAIFQGQIIVAIAGNPGMAIGVGLLSLVINLIATSLLAGSTVNLVGAIYLGKKMTAMEAISKTISDIGRIIGAQMLVGVWVFLGFLCLIIPGIYMMFHYLLVVPAVILDKKSGSAALARSKQLTKLNVNKVIGTLLLMGLLTFLIAVPLLLAFGFATAGMGLEVDSIVNVFGNQMVSIILGPLSTIALVLVYYDVRITHEAFDLEVLSGELGKS